MAASPAEILYVTGGNPRIDEREARPILQKISAALHGLDIAVKYVHFPSRDAQLATDCPYSAPMGNPHKLRELVEPVRASRGLVVMNPYEHLHGEGASFKGAVGGVAWYLSRAVETPKLFVTHRTPYVEGRYAALPAEDWGAVVADFKRATSLNTDYDRLAAELSK